MNKISVIIPAYNMEKFLEKCLNSIINQTHTNLEIIVVNDFSTDKTNEIIENFINIDTRIKVVHHEKNRGLFQARLSGTSIATGDFIAFVDADDYITPDFYRLMLQDTLNADIIVGNTIFESETNWKYITNLTQNFTTNTSKTGTLEGSDIFGSLLDGEGLNFSWHTVWNKLYKKELWDRCVPHYNMIKTHLIMTEDIVFSFVLYFYATKLKFTDASGYIYYRHSEASTGEIQTVEKLQKTINDLCVAFTFVKNFMHEVSVYEQYETKFLAFRQRYFRWWSPNVEKFSLQKSGKAIKKMFLSTFDEPELIFPNKDDGYFGSIVTGFQQNYLHLKNRIIDPKIKTISFDIFDTLIVRPFLEPTDLFLLMQPHFEALSGKKSNFQKLRIQAEASARSSLNHSNVFFEDVTLSEIYDKFTKLACIPYEISAKIMQKEMELEINFCYARQSIKELFDLALYLKKDVIITSDMYLPSDTILKILDKNGIKGYKKLYVSSETRVLKHTKNMFKHIAFDLKIKDKKSVLHIGDTQSSDIYPAKSFGFEAFYTPKTKDVFFGNSEYKSNLDSRIFTTQNGSNFCNTNALKSLEIRCMLAVVANKIFDNPFVSFAPNSAFNADPYYVGYYALGMHLFGVCTWLSSTAVDYDKIHFIARDGYLPKQVYDIVSKYFSNAPKSNYLYASRKSLLPSTINENDTFSHLSDIFEAKNHTGYSILELFSDIINPIDETTFDAFKNNGVLLNSQLDTQSKIDAFFEAFTKISYSQTNKNEYETAISSYFSANISQNDCTFDLGYSGKIQKMLCDILGFKINAFYVHTNGSSTEKYAQKNSFTINSFYQHTPLVSGILREYLVSDYAPSCVSYQDGEPVFESQILSYQERHTLDLIQKGAVDFASDFSKIFGDYLHNFSVNPIECSLPFEYFLSNPTEIDMNIFASSYVEDAVHSGNSNLQLTDCWRNYLKSSNSLNSQSSDIFENGIYEDGLIVALARKINVFFPEGGRKRKVLKKFISFFIK